MKNAFELRGDTHMTQHNIGRRLFLKHTAMGSGAALLAANLSAQTPSPTGTATCAGRAAPREDIEWVNVWITGADKSDQPRALLIGDSITQSYYGSVEKRLQGKARVARMTSSRCIGDPVLLKEIDLLLCQYAFSVIHFNNGLHGWGTNEADFAAYFPEYLAAIRKGNPNAKLVWGRITPLRTAGKLAEYRDSNPRVIARNAIADRLIKQAGIPATDLYGAVEGHPEFYSSDGTHMNAQGVEALAAAVASGIEKRL